MSELEKAFSKLAASGESNPVDVSFKLLEPQDSVMHTDIRSPKVMNAMLLQKNMAKSVNWNKTAHFWRILYKAQVVHMVSYKRQRSKEIVEIQKALMALLGLSYQREEEKKGGLFGKK